MVVVVALFAAVVPLSSASGQALGSVIINEILTSNSSVLADDDGDFSDWIELHNPGNAQIALGGWSITDTAGPGGWLFPAGTVIAANGYLVVFASGKDRVGGQLHTDFKLSAGGEYLGLYNDAGVVVDELAPSYPAQSSDVSWGVASDGGQAFFVDPSPGAVNGGPQVLGEVVFSQPHGFYSGSITVSLSAEAGAAIRYSIDGSDPTTGSVYSNALSLNQTTTLRAVAIAGDGRASRISTQTYLFLDDVIAQSETPPGFPTSPVNGQVFDWGMDPDVVNGNEAAVKNSLLSIPTISLVTDVDSLFASDVGIYVNPTRTGRDWERPGSFEVIDPTGANPGIDANTGLRIRGGASRTPSNPKHSFRLFFRSDYGDEALNYPLFGDAGAESFDKIDLRSAQNYSWSKEGSTQNTMLRERWSRDTQAAMGQPNTRSDHYHLYINGQYFGVVQTQERVTKDYAEEYLGGDDDDYDVVKHNRENGYRFEASDGTEDAWRSLWPLISDAAVSNAEFDTLSDQVDLENLADYFLLHFYSGDFDGPTSWFLGAGGLRYVRGNNWYGARDRVDGKWQFFDHDSEHSLCTRNVGPRTGADIDNTGILVGAANPVWEVDYLNPGWLHQVLITNENYRQIFADRVQLHLLNDGGALTTAVGQARLDSLANTVRPAVLAHSARWGDTRVAVPRGLSDWEAEIAWVRDDCLTARTDVVSAQLASDDLMPTVAPPSFDTEGAVAWNEAVTIAGPGGSTILYTIDGSDPLGPDRQPSASSVASATVRITDYITVIARARVDGEWSAPTTASFTLDSALGDPHIILNEYNAVGASELLGNDGVDEVFGRVAGNGGDWFELVVLGETVDLRGWGFEIQDTKSGELATRDRLVLTDSMELAQIPKGTIITISEDRSDDLSYNPAAGDWSINLQANAAGDGGFFTAESQGNFDTNEHDWQLIIRDGAGVVSTLRTGESAGALTGVSDTDVGKLEVAANAGIGPNSPYDDGTTSTYGLPNRWDDQVQDLLPIRYLPGDADASSSVDAADVMAILDSNVGKAGITIDTVAADLDNNGQVDLLDALILAQSLPAG